MKNKKIKKYLKDKISICNDKLYILITSREDKELTESTPGLSVDIIDSEISQYIIRRDTIKQMLNGLK